jgi:predicted ATPase with chaperone activity
MPHKQVVVNMAPADIRKEGSAYDLPLAIGILAADGKSTRSASTLRHYGRIVAGWKFATDKRFCPFLSKPEKKNSKDLSCPSKMRVKPP